MAVYRGMPRERESLAPSQRARTPVTCDVSAISDPDLATIDLIARLQLVAKRGGFRLRLRGCSGALRELVLLAGLDDALPMEGSASGGKPRREAEEREEAGGVEEEGDSTDSAG